MKTHEKLYGVSMLCLLLVACSLDGEFESVATQVLWFSMLLMSAGLCARVGYVFQQHEVDEPQKDAEDWSA